MKTKSFKFEFDIKALEEKGQIVGYGSVFNGTDSYGDTIAPGAFTKTLQERQPALLWQHDTAQPIGVWESVEQDKKGLKVEGQLNLDTQLGRETHSLLKQGALNGLSIGFRPRKWEDKEDEGNDDTDDFFSWFFTPPRTYKEVELLEISVVTFPADDAALIDGVKNQFVNSFDELTEFQKARTIAYMDALRSLDLPEQPTALDFAKIKAVSEIIKGNDNQELGHSEDKADTISDVEQQEALHSIEAIIAKFNKGKI